MKFSPRLQAIFEECTPGEPLADLCCDHGHLGVHAYLQKSFPEILFVDQVAHTMANLEKKFDQYVRDIKNPSQVRFLTQDAGTLSFTFTGTLVIAGVGGVNMMRILSRLQEAQVLQNSSLVLAPHRDAVFFETHQLFGFQQTNVKRVTEKGIVRPIFTFRR